MSKSSYPPHGIARLSVDGRLLVVHGTGPANLEMMQQYQLQVSVFKELLSKSGWGCLIILDGTPIGTAEAKVMLSEVVRQSKKIGLCATAVVFLEPEFNGMLSTFWQEIYENEGVTFGCFSTENEARSWLAEALTTAD